MNGIETRVPLLDNNLIDYGLNLSPSTNLKENRADNKKQF